MLCFSLSIQMWHAEHLLGDTYLLLFTWFSSWILPTSFVCGALGHSLPILPARGGGTQLTAGRGGGIGIGSWDCCTISNCDGRRFWLELSSILPMFDLQNCSTSSVSIMRFSVYALVYTHWRGQFPITMENILPWICHTKSVFRWIKTEAPIYESL